MLCVSELPIMLVKNHTKNAYQNQKFSYTSSLEISVYPSFWTSKDFTRILYFSYHPLYIIFNFENVNLTEVHAKKTKCRPNQFFKTLYIVYTNSVIV